MRASSATYFTADDGLLLAGLKSRKSRLSSKLLNKSDYDFPTVFEGLVEEIERMTLKSSEHNQLIIGRLQAPTSDYYLERNAIPVFWWPLNLDLIEAILFHDAQILTFQNPAHLAEKLGSNGFDVESSKEQQGLRVSKKRDERVLWLTGFHHFLGMVSRQLWTEDSVVQTVVNITNQIEESDISLAGGVELDIVQDFG